MYPFYQELYWQMISTKIKKWTVRKGKTQDRGKRDLTLTQERGKGNPQNDGELSIRCRRKQVQIGTYQMLWKIKLMKKPYASEYAEKTDAK